MAKETFRGQYEDEEVLYFFRKHPVVMRKGLIIASLGLLVGPLYVLAVSYLKPEYTPNEIQYLFILLAGVLLFAILLFPSWVYWYFSVYILTNQRFVQVTQKGFFKKRFSDVGLNQIQSINYQVVGIQETLLGFGTIVVQSYLGDIVINDVHHPEHVSKELSHLLRENGAMQAPQTDEGQKNSHERVDS